MTDNERSLISHALKIYGMQYNDNIKLDHYITCIEVVDPNIQDLYVLRVYKGIGGINIQMYKNCRNTSSNVNINIRSFINHWLRYYNVNENITHVAVRKCLGDTFDISILSPDTVWNSVIISLESPVEDWIIYNW